MKIVGGLLVLLFGLVACQKDDHSPLGDDSIYDVTLDTIAIDTMSGRIFSDCSGTPAPGEWIEIRRVGSSYGEYIDEMDSIQTDTDGYFKYIWYIRDGDETLQDHVLLVGRIPSNGQTILFNNYIEGNQYVEFSLTDSLIEEIHFNFMNTYTVNDTLWYNKYSGAAYNESDAEFLTGPFSDTTVFLPKYSTSLEVFVLGTFNNSIQYAIGYSNFFVTANATPNRISVPYYHNSCTPLDSVFITVY